MGIEIEIQCKDGHKAVELNRRQAILGTVFELFRLELCRDSKLCNVGLSFAPIPNRQRQTECKASGKSYSGLLPVVHGLGTVQKMLGGGFVRCSATENPRLMRIKLSPYARVEGQAVVNA